LNNNGTFKQVIPIQNKDVESKIVETYRIQFLKDVALARLLDDGTFSTLNSLAFYNQSDLVNYFQRNHQYLNQLFSILSDENEIPKKKKNVILFLHELSSLAKSVHMVNRSLFFQ